jgi:hypothetical protein
MLAALPPALPEKYVLWEGFAVPRRRGGETIPTLATYAKVRRGSANE